MPAPRARSSTEIAESGRSSSSRSQVPRIAVSRSSPVGRDGRRPRERVGTADMRCTVPTRDLLLNRLLTGSTDCRYGGSVAAEPNRNEPDENDVDVLIIGAGLSGIGAAARLRTDSPGRSFAILEARGAIGGTWDLFRYPGIRSD